MRTHRHAKFGCHQHHREDLVHSAKPRRVDLTDGDRIRLQELLEHHPVLAVLAGGDLDRRHRAGDGGVAEHIVGTGRLLNPPWIEARQLLHPGDRLVDIPDLVGVHHQLALGTDLFADDPCPSSIVLQVAADFLFEVGPALGDALAAQLSQVLVGIAEPAGGGGVCRVAVLLQVAFALRPAGLVAADDIERFVWSNRVGDVAKRHTPHELLRRQVRQQLPQRLALRLRPQVPHGIHDGGGGEMDDALLGADPAELALAGEGVPQRQTVATEVLQRLAADEWGE